MAKKQAEKKEAFVLEDQVNKLKDPFHRNLIRNNRLKQKRRKRC
ncbi:hypothetical protein ACF3NR_00735 [Vaginella massiliensis]|nr:hypothetical protein [Vaginella massiliensis]